MTRILWIIPKWPFPMNDGGRITMGKLMLNTAKLLAKDKRKQLRIIFIVPHQPELGNHQLTGEDLEIYDQLQANFIFIERLSHQNFNVKNILLSIPTRFAPLILMRFSALLVQKEVSKVISLDKPDVIFAEGLEGCVSVAQDIPICYRSHNVEYEIWEHYAKTKKSRLLRLFCALESLLLRKTEIAQIKRSQITFAITDENRDKYLSLVADADVVTLPVGLPFINFKKRIYPCFAFIGDLNWYPNYHGLQWFLQEVWRHYEGNSKLYLVGKGPRPDLSGLKEIIDLGVVRNLAKVYRVAQATISPIFIGSGARVKIVESASYQTATIASRFAASGLGLKENEIFYAETREEWLQALDVERDKFTAVGHRAFAALKRYDIRACAQVVVDKLCKHPH